MVGIPRWGKWSPLEGYKAQKDISPSQINCLGKEEGKYFLCQPAIIERGSFSVIAEK